MELAAARRDDKWVNRIVPDLSSQVARLFDHRLTPRVANLVELTLKR